jgi:hypothetical protein
VAIERQTINEDGTLTTWYLGTEKQWRRCSLLETLGERAFTPTYVSRHIALQSPSGFRGWGYPSSVTLRGDQWRISVAKEGLAEWYEAVDDGIEAFGYRGRVFYYGPTALLLSKGIAPPEIDQRTWWRANGDWGPVVWECEEDTYNGQRCFVDCVAEREAYRKEQEDKQKNDWASIDEYRDAQVRIASVDATLLLRSIRRSEVKDGTIYRYEQSATDKIAQKLEEVYALLASAGIVTTRTHGAAKLDGRMASAQADARFGAFMHSIGVRRGADS